MNKEEQVGILSFPERFDKVLCQGHGRIAHDGRGNILVWTEYWMADRKWLGSINGPSIYGTGYVLTNCWTGWICIHWCLEE